MTERSRPQRLALVCSLLAACIGSGLLAGELDPGGWVIRDPGGTIIPHAADGSIETVWVSDAPQRPGMAVTVDLGTDCWLHRVYLTPGELIARYPRSLRLRIGDARGRMQTVAEVRASRDTECDLRFNPRVGRFLQLELTGEGAGYPWAIAEMLVFGGPGNPAASNCVVVTRQAPPLLRQAAEDLRYYTSELLSQPIPLVDALGAVSFTGWRLRVMPVPDYGPYGDYLADPRSQHPERIEVARYGREIRFSGHTHRGVLYASSEFLHRQGVRWAAPGALGDFVTPREALDLSMLPLRAEPSFARRYANWNTERFQSRPANYLWYYRNRWNSSWGGPLNDRPSLPAPDHVPAVGYTHTFDTLVPASRFETHPEWFPLLREARWIRRIGPHKLGKRIPYGTTWGGLNFCTSNPGVRDHIVSSIRSRTDPRDARATVWLTPMDAGVFCECDNCRQLDDPDQPDTGPWQAGLSLTPRYMHFICSIARRTSTATPNVRIGAFAYEGYIDPPGRVNTLPDNVDVDVIQYGTYNLPPAASTNAWMTRIMQGWAGKFSGSGQLGVYDWSLRMADAGKLPVPLVTALSGRMKLWHRLGARRVGTEAHSEPHVWRWNPWNYYAYSRLAWDVQTDPATLLDEFFSAYYREAGGHMLQYYLALETHLLDNEIPLGNTFFYKPSAQAFPSPVLAAMRRHLASAEAAADHWVTRQRVRDARQALDWTAAQLARTGP